MSARCIHFGVCGGCTLHDIPQTEYRAEKRGSVVRALTKQGLGDADVAEVVAVAGGSRRRAVFKIARKDGTTQVGFHALKSHSIVDMRECLVLTPALVMLAAHLRTLMNSLLGNGQHAEVHVTEADNGIDASFRANVQLKPALTAAFAKAAPGMGVIRIQWNGALAFENAAPTVRFGKADVKLPPECFLQPTRAGEAALLARVLAATKGAKAIADLFSGCGTFSLPLAERARVHAMEKDDTMLAALLAAAKATSGLKPVTTARRDLFKVPLNPVELSKFDTVTLDPPRAGAHAQAVQLAKSKIARIAYVSCDAGSFARDARILVDGGYRMGTVTPVDQFLWSEHIELVAAFSR
ncbi:MAG: class I SAM-dependent RNA methyltransferase [Rhizomicrobium sp.]